ncbi:hypothetical protein, partial [Mesorhizobium sp. L48C026A00]|uniref:hypothetical protein n=1 Tax=Mesorhizobium sp. L48C026A00 TaxID=1287182 RepID=UPI001AEC52EC
YEAGHATELDRIAHRQSERNHLHSRGRPHTARSCEKGQLCEPTKLYLGPPSVGAITQAAIMVASLEATYSRPGVTPDETGA